MSDEIENANEQMTEQTGSAQESNGQATKEAAGKARRPSRSRAKGRKDAGKSKGKTGGSAAPKKASNGASKKEKAPAVTSLPEVSVQRLATIVRLMQEPARIRLIVFLGGSEQRYVGELCECLGMPQPAVSHHLSLMRAANLIEPNRQGKQIFYSLSPNGRVVNRVLHTLLADTI